MTWKLAFTLIIVLGGILTGLAPLFLFTDFRADLGVGTMLIGLLVGIIVLLSAGVPIGFATGVLGRCRNLAELRPTGDSGWC